MLSRSHIRRDAKVKKTMRDVLSYKTGSIIVLVVVMQIMCILLVPRYSSVVNFRVLLRAIPELGIVAIGVCLLMIAGEFDLSIGSTLALTAFIMSLLFKNGLNIWLSFLISLIAGSLIGAMNGLITIKARIPSFITTLGTMMVWRGVVLVLSRGHPSTFLPPLSFHAILAGHVGLIQAQFIWFVGVAIFFWLLLENHKFGNSVFASGGNREAAAAIGVNPDRVKLICFVITGLLAAVAGCIGVTRVTSISALQGQGMELQAIAAVVIGGTSLRGGEGTILGAFLGATIIYTIQNILLLLRAPGFYFQLFIGILIITVVTLNAMIKRS